MRRLDLPERMKLDDLATYVAPGIVRTAIEIARQAVRRADLCRVDVVRVSEHAVFSITLADDDGGSTESVDLQPMIHPTRGCIPASLWIRFFERGESRSGFELALPFTGNSRPEEGELYRDCRSLFRPQRGEEWVDVVHRLAALRPVEQAAVFSALALNGGGSISTLDGSPADIFFVVDGSREIFLDSFVFEGRQLYCVEVSVGGGNGLATYLEILGGRGAVVEPPDRWSPGQWCCEVLGYGWDGDATEAQPYRYWNLDELIRSAS